MFKAESQGPEKHLAYKVRSHFAQQQLKAECLERKETWANEVIARIEYPRYVIAPNSVYHQSYSTLSLDWRETQMKTFLTTCHEEKHCIWSNFRY